MVSTDPASNLDEVLDTSVGTAPTPVPGAGGLAALNVDPKQAAAAYRERVIGPYRRVLPDSTVARVEEQLSGACTVEIAAFDEFTELLADDTIAAAYDHVVFDTAPTGHTLRLLALPAAWTTFMGDGTGTSCLGPLSGLRAQQWRYPAAVATLSDPARTTLLLVTRPDLAALTEAERAGAELRRLGISSQRLIINGVFTATAGTQDPLAAALEAQSKDALTSMPVGLAELTRTTVPLLVRSPLGIAGLRELAATDGSSTQAADVTLAEAPETARFSDVVDGIAAQGHGLVMTMGKGGVGKTTVAGAVAVALAARGHQVQLTTTDPAAHVAGVLGGDASGVQVARIDPVAETAAYTAEVLAAAGRDLDPGARAVLEEDLASPCTEEIAVFRAFARTVARAQDGFVVLDTAPTGHTLLLLDAARSIPPRARPANRTAARPGRAPAGPATRPPPHRRAARRSTRGHPRPRGRPPPGRPRTQWHHAHRLGRQPEPARQHTHRPHPASSRQRGSPPSARGLHGSRAAHRRAAPLTRAAGRCASPAGAGRRPDGLHDRLNQTRTADAR